MPEIRAIFGRFRIVEVTTTYSISGSAKGNGAARSELLVSNWDIGDPG